MSLVNDMLHDLEQRQQVQPNGDWPIIEPKKKSSILASPTLWLMLLCVFSLGYGGIYFWKNPKSDFRNDTDKVVNAGIESQQSENAQLSSQELPELPVLSEPLVLPRFPALSEPPVLQKSPEPIESDSIKPDTEVATQIAATVRNSYAESQTTVALPMKLQTTEQSVPADETEVEHNDDLAKAATQQIDSNQAEIPILLSEAEEFVRMGQLTTPEYENALNRYQQVLSLDKDNTLALAGVESLIRRYSAMVRAAIKNERHWRAQIYLRRAGEIAADYRQYSKLYESIEAEFSAWLTDYDAIENNRDTTVIRASNLDNTVIDSSLESNNVPQERTKLNMSPNLKYLENKAMAEAGRLIENGRIDLAVRDLELFTAAHPEAIAALRYLLNIYVENKNLAEVSKILNLNQSLSNTDKIFYESRIELTRGDPHQAINLLEGHQPRYLDSQEYYALLAALYHQQGRHSQAIDIYKKLLDVDPYHFSYWLGLAVSLDALENRSAALQAFESAKRLGGGDRESIRYIDQRISMLSEQALIP